MQKKVDSLFHQGRVLAVTGQADDFKEALRRAYEAVAKISFDPPGASGIVAALFICRLVVLKRSLERSRKTGMLSFCLEEGVGK